MYKTLIIGRTASGKDALANMLIQNQNWKFLKSYTTRQPRTPDENTHTFITKKEADAFNKEDIITDAVINGIKYFCTKDQLIEADSYIINPDALPKLFEKFPNVFFQIVYIKAISDEKRKEMAIKRAKTAGNESEIQIFETRNEAENKEFSEFENKLADYSFHGSNYDTIVLENDYDEQTLHNMAASIEVQRRYHKNMYPIVKTLINKGLMQTTEDGQSIIIHDKYDETITEQMTIEKMINLLAYDNEAMRKLLGDTIVQYLGITNGTIDPSVLPKCNTIPIVEPNQKLYGAWLYDTASQMITDIIDKQTEHIQMAAAICKKETDINLTEYTTQHIMNSEKELYNQMLLLIENKIRTIIRSIITPI